MLSRAIRPPYLNMSFTSTQPVPATTAMGMVLGSFLFRLVYTVALRLEMPAYMLKLVSSGIIILAIAGPYLRTQWPMLRRRLTYGGAGKEGR